ncbi:HAD-IIB family hydrolase [Amaricoccus macauensis]|uniref:HAD-IIB family hydrolase n=1 Tax=Amaricoccus macauensis TaxID=57001 RepID=UPI003C7E5119
MRIMHIALGGCLTAPPIKYGLTEDTGGHIAYVLGAATAQAERPETTDVTIVTRAFDAPELGPQFARPQESLGPKCRILRLRTDNARYLEKDALTGEIVALQHAFCALLRRMGPDRPDILHAHFSDAAELAAKASAEFSIPWIYTAHSLAAEKLTPGETPSPALAERIGRETRALQSARAIIASSRDEVERQIPRLVPGAEGRTFRVPPGVTIRQDGCPERARSFLAPFLRDLDKPVILAIARPIRKKNLGRLLEAYASDPALQEKANLVIVAGLRDGLADAGREQDAVIQDLFDKVDRADLWGKVALPRRHEARDVADLYALAARGGVFCNPALHEPFGLTLIEAAQSGVPIVATRNGGPSDILPVLGLGELVDPLDTASIAEGLNRSLGLTFREERARKTREAALRAFDWAAWASQANTIARDLIASPATTSARARAQPTASRPASDDERFLLACDIDNTLTGCPAGARQFAAWLDEGPRMANFAVATGRSVSEARRILSNWSLPEPDTIISSTGTEIWRRTPHGYALCPEFSATLSDDWPRAEIEALLRRLRVRPQPCYDQRRWKISLFGPADEARRIAVTLREADLAAQVIPSHGRFIDIVPARAGKAAAIRFEARRRGLPDDAVIVAGDSGNDLCMLGAFPRAILPANALPELDGLTNGYRSPFRHARGVLDGLAHFGVDAPALRLAGE